jgi:hypothetical protein
MSANCMNPARLTSAITMRVMMMTEEVTLKPERTKMTSETEARDMDREDRETSTMSRY